MRVMKVLAATLVIGLAGCHNDSTGPVGPMEGTWQGSVTGLSMDLYLTDRGGKVSGTGDMAGSDVVNPPIMFNVSGTENGSTFVTTLTATDRTGTVSFTGSVTSSTTLTASLDGSGFTSLGISFTRQ